MNNETNQNVGIPLEQMVPNNNPVVPQAQPVSTAAVPLEQVAPVAAPQPMPAVQPVAPAVVSEVAPVVNPAEVPAPVESKKVEENKVVTSGTITEEQLVIDASKEKVEVLDEYEINKDAANMKEKDKKKVIFIIIIFILLFAFVIAMPYLIKKFGF